jgi:AcrR family transcriptional regulator
LSKGISGVPKILSKADIAAFRERLCDIAEEKFAARGPDAVTLRDLADAMGVSSMTPYRYFKDKDAILAAVRARAFNRFAQAMEDAFEALKDGRQSNKQPGGAYIDFALNNRAAYRMMFDVNQPTMDQYPDLVAAMDRAKDTMTAGWKHMKAKGMMQGDVETIAHIFWAAMHGPIMLELAGLLHKPLDGRSLATKAILALQEQFRFTAEKEKRKR